MPCHPLQGLRRSLFHFLAGAVAVFSVMASTAHASNLRRTAEVIAIERARPSVVNIHGRKTLSKGQEGSRGDEVNGMGTGIVIDERGYIVTNYHVVEGVGRIQVTTATGQTVVAELVSRDTKTDLAIIKIEVDEPLPPIQLGTSRDLMTGEPVIAIGNAYGYTHTVTRGIISALHRPIEVSETQSYRDLIQTDASINPGNSGGPLLNIDGEMIGINVAVRMGAQGIGFALPVDETIEVVSKLLDDEVAHTVSVGIVGKTTSDGERTRFVVTQVPANGGASASGVRVGDVIVSVDGKPVVRSLDFQCAMIGRQPGDELSLVVTRGAEEISTNLVLGDVVSGQRSIAAQAWQALGLRLAAAPGQAVSQINSKYRGGMRIVAVRPDSPAAVEGIRPGDILVGLHKWETISMDNVAYILESDEFIEAQPAKFFVLRGTDTLYGQIRISQRGR